jgi:hypothetical protein
LGKEIAAREPVRMQGSLVSWGFAAVGATVLYSTWGRRKLRPYLLSDLIDTLPISENLRVWIEFVVFIGIGTVVAVALTRPSNQAQAFSAGLGWTGLVVRPTERRGGRSET